MEKCRKGFQENVGFRPDLFENFYNHDKEFVASILEQQEKYRKGEITFEKLQQFYADSYLLPSFSKYEKSKTNSATAMEAYLGTFPSPKNLTRRDSEKPFEGHQIAQDLLKTASQIRDEGTGKLAEKQSRSTIKFHSITRTPSEAVRKSNSKISFRLNKSALASKSSLKVGHLKNDSKAAFKQLSFGNLIDEMNQDVLKEGPKEYIPEEELHKLRRRLVMAQPLPNKPPEPKNEKERFLRVLREHVDSMPDKEEYCDSDRSRTCDLKKLSEDKFEELKHWGKRIFTLHFDETPTARKCK